MNAQELKATELRIGNLIIGENGNILPVDYITKDRDGNFIIGLLNEMGGTDKHQKNPIISYDIDKLKYVPLTEEWLLRAGFEVYPHKLLDGYIKIRNGVYFFKYHKLEIELEFVHQLQNLYWYLCGKELCIKLH